MNGDECGGVSGMEVDLVIGQEGVDGLAGRKG